MHYSHKFSILFLSMAPCSRELPTGKWPWQRDLHASLSVNSSCAPSKSCTPNLIFHSSIVLLSPLMTMAVYFYLTYLVHYFDTLFFLPIFHLASSSQVYHLVVFCFTHSSTLQVTRTAFSMSLMLVFIFQVDGDEELAARGFFLGGTTTSGPGFVLKM